jgi:hypothetical protein
VRESGDTIRNSPIQRRRRTSSRLQREPWPRSRRLRDLEERPRARQRPAALQLGDERPRGPHPLGELRLGQPARRPRVQDRPGSSSS